MEEMNGMDGGEDEDEEDEDEYDGEVNNLAREGDDMPHGV